MSDVCFLALNNPRVFICHKTPSNKSTTSLLHHYIQKASNDMR